MDEPVMLAKPMGVPSIITQNVESLIHHVASGYLAHVPSSMDGETESLLSLPEAKPSPRQPANGSLKSRVYKGSSTSQQSNAASMRPAPRLSTEKLLSILRDGSPETNLRYPSNVPPTVLHALQSQRGLPRGRSQPRLDEFNISERESVSSDRSISPLYLDGDAQPSTSYEGRPVDASTDPYSLLATESANRSGGLIRAKKRAIKSLSTGKTKNPEMGKFNRNSVTQSAFRSMAASAAGMMEASLPDIFFRKPDLNDGSIASLLNKGYEDKETSTMGDDERGLSNDQRGEGDRDLRETNVPEDRPWRYMRSPGARHCYRQQALWVMEEPGLGLPRSHPDHMEALRVSFSYLLCVRCFNLIVRTYMGAIFRSLCLTLRIILMLI